MSFLTNVIKNKRAISRGLKKRNFDIKFLPKTVGLKLVFMKLVIQSNSPNR